MVLLLSSSVRDITMKNLDYCFRGPHRLRQSWRVIDYFGDLLVITLGHPFDLTKVRLQTAPKGTYTGALDVVKKTLARDGVKGYVDSLACLIWHFYHIQQTSAFLSKECTVVWVPHLSE